MYVTVGTAFSRSTWIQVDRMQRHVPQSNAEIKTDWNREPTDVLDG